MKQDYGERATKFWHCCQTGLAWEVLTLLCTHWDIRQIIFLVGFLHWQVMGYCGIVPRTMYQTWGMMVYALVNTGAFFLGCWDLEHRRCWGWGVLILSTFVLVNHGSSGNLLALVGTFLFMQPASNPPSALVSDARPVTPGQGRAWSKTGLQLSISLAPPSLAHPHPPRPASWRLQLLLSPCEIPTTVLGYSAHYTKAYWIPDAAWGPAL